MSEENLANILSELDLDRNGEIDKNDFLEVSEDLPAVLLLVVKVSYLIE